MVVVVGLLLCLRRSDYKRGGELGHIPTACLPRCQGQPRTLDLVPFSSHSSPIAHGQTALVLVKLVSIGPNTRKPKPEPEGIYHLDTSLWKAETAISMCTHQNSSCRVQSELPATILSLGSLSMPSSHEDVCFLLDKMQCDMPDPTSASGLEYPPENKKAILRKHSE